MRYPRTPGELIGGLDFEVPNNGFMSFLGRTGAGKTTMLRIIAGLEQRFRGSVSMDGVPVLGPGRSVQLVFQDMRLLPWKTVQGNVEFATRDPRSPREIAQVEKWLSIVGLEHRRNAWPRTLSGGEEARVAFARAFVDQPKLLLLDEPFRGLDIMTRYSLQNELLKALAASPTTVLMVSHSIEDAVFLSDTVHVLSEAPMAIQRTFMIDLQRPRLRGCKELASHEAEIARYMADGRAGDGEREKSTPVSPSKIRTNMEGLRSG
ncbi:MAG: ABC transporter ATP-binding protein [Prosthecobacter sp.]|nr:ABC transporter ATP-binding protein [Prosthecobacter sp.]